METCSPCYLNVHSVTMIKILMAKYLSIENECMTFLSTILVYNCFPYGNDTTASTETEMLSFWWNFNHWLHRKLSFWQLSVQPVMKISSKWRHFCFSVPLTILECNLKHIQCPPVTKCLPCYLRSSNRLDSNKLDIGLQFYCSHNDAFPRYHTASFYQTKTPLTLKTSQLPLWKGNPVKYMHGNGWTFMTWTSKPTSSVWASCAKMIRPTSLNAKLFTWT